MNSLYKQQIIIAYRDLNFGNDIKLLMNENGFDNIQTSKLDNVTDIINKEIQYLIITDCDDIYMLKPIKDIYKNADIVVVSNKTTVSTGYMCLSNGASLYFHIDEIKETPQLFIQSIMTLLDMNNRSMLLVKQIEMELDN